MRNKISETEEFSESHFDTDLERKNYVSQKSIDKWVLYELS